MSLWVKTEDGGYVNLDQAVQLTPAATQGPQSREQAFVVTMVNGASASVTFDKGVFLPDLLAPIVSAMAGEEALLVTTDNVGRPTEVSVNCCQIIGWRIRTEQDHPGSFASAAPIVVEAAIGRELMILLPDGRVLSPLRKAEYDSIETMKAAVLETAQAEWDKVHPTGS